jgi:hypothetical protein
MNRACGVAAALAVIADTRVTIWPGWSVPLAAVILAASLAVLGAGVSALAAVIVSRTWPRRVRAGVRPQTRTDVRRVRTETRTDTTAVRAGIPVLRLTLSDPTSKRDAG